MSAGKNNRKSERRSDATRAVFNTRLYSTKGIGILYIQKLEKPHTAMLQPLWAYSPVSFSGKRRGTKALLRHRPNLRGLGVGEARMISERVPAGNVWRFSWVMQGYPQSSSISRLGFSMKYTPSSELGVPPWLWKPHSDGNFKPESHLPNHSTAWCQWSMSRLQSYLGGTSSFPHPTWCTSSMGVSFEGHELVLFEGLENSATPQTHGFSRALYLIATISTEKHNMMNHILFNHSYFN